MLYCLLYFCLLRYFCFIISNMKHIYWLMFLLFLTVPLSVSGQSANALISEVNALRAANGLEPYTPDADLMALAQAQSEYQASIHQSTHARPDGSGTPARSENVCGGIGVNASYCVNSMWTDGEHRYTMIGLDSGLVGAGLAESEGNSYYTLMVSGSGKETGLASLSDVAENQIPIDPDSMLLQADQIVIGAGTEYLYGLLIHAGRLDLSYSPDQ